MAKNKMLALFFYLVAGGITWAQTVSDSVKIKALNSNEKNPLRVYEVERNVETTGNIVSTTIEYMIENKTDRILEGEFEFSLKEGESVTGYALDINGVMRQGVVVEKAKGRQIFEENIRKKIDPGLVEMTAGNNFKTRVYPINAKGVRHIQITVEYEKKEPFSEIYTQTTGKDSYFYFCLDEPNQSGLSENKIPASIAVYFDVSASAKNRQLSKEIEFLTKYVENGVSQVEVIPFANESLSSKNFGKNGEKIENLQKYLSGLAFDGATSLSLDFSKCKADQILVFSDGIDNWNNLSLPENCKVPVYTVCCSSSANYGLLNRIANQNGGFFLNLGELSVQDGLKKMKENPLRIVKVEYNSSEISDVYPQAGSIVNGPVTVSGRLIRKSGKIKFSLGKNGKVEKVVEKEVSAIGSKESAVIEKIWAGKKIDELSMDYDSNRNEILELSKKYRIVTKETSLIVLDTVQDYVRYQIEPPAELLDEYNRLTAGRNTVKPVSDSGIPSRVYTKFEEYRKWWNMSPSDFKKIRSDKKEPIRPNPPIFRREYAEPLMESRAVERVSNDAVIETAEVQVFAERANAVASVSTSAKATNSAVSSGAQADRTGSAAIVLQAWSSKSEYLTVLKKTETSKMYEKYLELKKDYENSPSFYMEVSDYFAEEGLKAESIRILSNLAEINLENTDVLRAMGYKLSERGEFNLAVPVFEKLVKLRQEVPQFLRDLALAYKNFGEYQKAVDCLWKIAGKDWDSRYTEIQQTALNDMNAIIEEAERKKVAMDLNSVDKKLKQNYSVDLRIVLTWNTDDCDIDLWVTDPDGEKCYYGHNLTSLGGRMSRDFTQGYGPEEFAIKQGKKGKYKIEANYFGNHQQKVLQPVTVQAEVYTNFGRPDQECKVLTLELKDTKQTFFIGEVEL